MRGTLHFILWGTCVTTCLATCGSAYGQSLVEGAAVAAGVSAGGIAGKKVSDGITIIRGKADKQTAKLGDVKNRSAAKSTDSPSHKGGDVDTSIPLIEVGRGAPRADPSNVPSPPPLRRAAVRKPAPPPELPAPVIEPPPPVPEPPPAITAEDLKRVTSGMQRGDVLKLGEPTSRITMVDEGHLLEIYSYQAKDATLGEVRLTDGSVSNVLIR